MFYIWYSWQGALFSAIVYLIMVFVAKPQVTWCDPVRNNTKKGIYIFFFLLVVNSVFAFWSYDTYHSWETFILSNHFSQFSLTAYENIYNWLADAVGGRYFVWRACIWVPACLFIYYTAKRLGLLNRNFLVAMVLFGSFLSYTRGMLGHIMLLFGVVLVFEEKYFVKKVLGLTLVCVSLFFHKSIYVNIIFVLISLVPFEKKIIGIAVLMFPLLLGVTDYIVEFVLSGQVDLGSSEDATIGYLEARQDRISFNIIGVIRNAIEGAGLILSIVYCYDRIYVKQLLDREGTKRIFLFLFRLTFVCFYSAYLFYFNNEVSGWIFHRFRYMGYFPLIFLVAKMMTLEPRSCRYIKWVLVLILSATFAEMYSNINHWYHGVL